MEFYSDAQADNVATQFFQHYYHDRGKIKWEGFFLSDHNAALRNFRQHQGDTPSFDEHYVPGDYGC